MVANNRFISAHCRFHIGTPAIINHGLPFHPYQHLRQDTVCVTVFGICRHACLQATGLRHKSSIPCCRQEHEWVHGLHLSCCDPEHSKAPDWHSVCSVSYDQALVDRGPSIATKTSLSLRSGARADGKRPRTSQMFQSPDHNSATGHLVLPVAEPISLQSQLH